MALKSKSRRTLILALTVLFNIGILAAYGDAITAQGVKYENVYIVESPRMYYVNIPKDGSVVSFSKANVDPASVVITEDVKQRNAIRDEWRKNQEKRTMEGKAKEEEERNAKAEEQRSQQREVESLEQRVRSLRAEEKGLRGSIDILRAEEKDLRGNIDALREDLKRPQGKPESTNVIPSRSDKIPITSSAPAQAQSKPSSQIPGTPEYERRRSALQYDSATDHELKNRPSLSGFSNSEKEDIISAAKELDAALRRR